MGRWGEGIDASHKSKSLPVFVCVSVSTKKMYKSLEFSLCSSFCCHHYKGQNVVLRASCYRGGASSGGDGGVNQGKVTLYGGGGGGALFLV